MRSGERQSPIRTALACGVLGVTALVGGNIVDHYDGRQESAPADIAKFGGGVLALLGTLKGANILAGKKVLEMRIEKEEEKQKLLDRLPRLQNEFDPYHIIHKLRLLESDSHTDDSIDPLAVSRRLLSTKNAVYGSPPHPDLVLEFFHKDVQEVIYELADSKHGIGPIPGGYILDRGDKISVMPNQIIQFARFLDDAVPLRSTTNEQPNWYSWLSARAADIRWSRLLYEIQRA